MSQPRASIIISTWNGRHLLETCLPLVLRAVAHSGIDHEVIVVDDASTDETQAVGQALADPWKGIHYIRNDVLVGSAAAMNIGIRASFGKGIAPLDAHDMIESNRLEVM